MTMKTVIASAAASVAAIALLAVAAHAQQPVQNVDPARHGNLASAQQLVVQAFDRLTAAQQDNNYDLGGHVGRAKDLLRQANWEIKQAADTVNNR
jgi:hypothetical protein